MMPRHQYRWSLSKQCSYAGPCAAAVNAVRIRLKTIGISSLTHQGRAGNGVVMAQKIQTLLVDDIDGSEAEGTVRFGLDGAEYEIDLSAEHVLALRDAVARYVAAARRSLANGRYS